MKFNAVLMIGIVSVLLVLVMACQPAVVTVEDSKEEVAAGEAEKEEEAVEAAEAEEAESPAETMAPVDTANPMVDEVLTKITFVQHHHDAETKLDTFTCASSGQGLNGVEADPDGPRFVGPNAGDFDLWGGIGLFRIDPDGTIEFVPQKTGGKFLDPEGVEQESFTLEETLAFFAGDDAIWTGAPDEAGRIEACNPEPSEDEGDAAEAEEAAAPKEPVEPADRSNPKVNELLNQVTLVQHHFDTENEVESFTCASPGLGLNGVEVDPEGPRFVGPNSADFDLWGIVALFKVDSDGSISLVPQETGGKFVDPDGVEHKSFALEEALGFFASEDAVWMGDHGETGRIEDCDPAN